jgi:hypothetical protein
MRIPAPPTNVWVIVVGALWCALMIKLGEWLAAGWPEVML